MWYAAGGWDPGLIVAQLLLLLAALYVMTGAWLALFALVFGTPLRLHALLLPAAMHVQAGSGWAALAAALLQAPLLGYLLLPVVGRAKQCLDFTLSTYVLHLLACSLYSGGLPRCWEWWGASAAGATLATLLGEWLCLQQELEAIPLSEEERASRERRRRKQHDDNRHDDREHDMHDSESSGNHAPVHGSSGVGSSQERAGLLGSGGDQVTTTTIRLAPSNVFNV